MGLDVYLYQFKNLDADAILKLLQFSEEPWTFEAFERWRALPRPERDVFPSEKNKAESRKKLPAKARDLGLPQKIVDESLFGGTQISFQSKQHPKWPVGEWYSFSTVRELMEYFTRMDIYFVFPEARDGWSLFRPNWAASRKRLAKILKELQKLKPARIEDFHSQFVMPHVQWLLEKLKPDQLATAEEVFAGNLAQIEVMIETLDFVLYSENTEEFLLYWSD